MKRLLVILLATAVFAAACTNGQSALDPTALSVDGSTVSVAQLNDEMTWLEENPSAANRIFNAGAPGAGGELQLHGEAAGSWNPDIVAVILTLHAQRFLIEDTLAEIGAEITEADRQAARRTLDSRYGEPNPQTGMIEEGTVASMPEGLSATLVTLEATNEAALRVVLADGGGEVTEAELRERYDDAVAFFEEEQAAMTPPEPGPCASHILFFFDADDPGAGEPTDEQLDEAFAAAEATLADLEAGADFAELAAERSDDPGSAADGGRLPCLPPGSYVAEFEAAAAQLEVGELSEPVVTDFGVHIIRRDADEEPDEQAAAMDEPEIPSFEEIRSELQVQMESERGDELLRERLVPIFEAVLERAEVEVDPRFGTWDDQAAQVIPPEGSSPAPVAPTEGNDDVPLFEDAPGIGLP
ncbi:MAG: peptidylprolyl isomerase [Acidimicrobiia bacterium]|nr:peptidylprolyl isomerase [Acidimicrobiia bacterium]